MIGGVRKSTVQMGMKNIIVWSLVRHNCVYLTLDL